MNEFEKAVAYALQRFHSPDLQLKNEQESSLRAVYSGKDTFIWLPTGFGKSLCYTALPFLFDYKLGRQERYIPTSFCDVRIPNCSRISQTVCVPGLSSRGWERG